jgi:hypothetical protein
MFGEYHLVHLYIYIHTGCNWKVWTKFWARVPHIEVRENVRNNVCPGTFNLWVTAERMRDCAPAHFSRAVRNVFNNSYHDGWIGRGGFTAWPPRSTPDLNPLDFYLWEHLKPLVYAAPLDNEEALHYRTVDACQTIRNCPGISEQMRRSMMRRVEACIESHGGHFEHLLWTYSFSCNSELNVPGHMLIWTSFLVLVCGNSNPKFVRTVQLRPVYINNLSVPLSFSQMASCRKNRERTGCSCKDTPGKLLI